jgi:hypothetical protein
VTAGFRLPECARRDSNARPLAPEPPEASDGQRPYNHSAVVVHPHTL